MKLYVVPTPIGNLEDITLRALRILKEEAQLIVAEDTRTSSVLLNHYEIKKPMQSFHKFNEHTAADKIAERIERGEVVALISDAGTPSISDPGYMLVRSCIERGIEVDCLPGATAFVPALVNSGLPADSFTFIGFLPVKKGKQTKMKELAELPTSFILYESPHRLVKTLEQLQEYCGQERQASVSREISKKFEETVRGTLQELAAHFTQRPPKGEIVMVIAPKERIKASKRYNNQDNLDDGRE